MTSGVDVLEWLYIGQVWNTRDNLVGTGLANPGTIDEIGDGQINTLAFDFGEARQLVHLGVDVKLDLVIEGRVQDRWLIQGELEFEAWLGPSH